VNLEFRTPIVEGSYRSLLWSAVGVPEDGLVYAAARDVTELREAESLFESAFADARLAMLVASVDPASLGRLTAVNAAACRFTGYSESQLTTRDFQSLMEPDDLDSILAELERLLAGEIDSFELEKRYRHAEGHVVWGRMHVSLIRDPAGVPLYAVGQVQDITDRMLAEEGVAAARRRFEQSFADAPIGMALQDADGRYVQVNRALCELLDRPEAELLSMRFQDLVHPDDLARDEDIRERMLAGEVRVAHREKHFRRGDGSWLEAQVAISCVPETEDLTRFIVQVQDVGDRNEIDRVVRRSRERLQAIIDGMPSVVFVKDLESRYEIVNNALAAGLGLTPSEMVGRLDSEVFDAATVETFAALESDALLSDVPVTHEETVLLGGARRTFLTHLFALKNESGVPDAIAGTAIDITDRIEADEERRRLEARAQEAQRLETVGRLAGGVAHDFNNLLTVILNNVSLATDTVPEGSEARGELEEIRGAAERAAELTHQLVQFSRQEIVEPRVLDPNAVVLRAERLLQRTIGEDIELRTAIGEGVPTIEIDPGQLERILLNLAVNARAAMPDGGTLAILTEAVDGGGDPCARISVRDSGHGMTPEIAARAFEPFFTTRPSGEGAGLGLATVYGIVKQAGGVVEIESSVGEGTEVTMRFPAARAAATAPLEPRVPAAQPRQGRGETLLVVEDEDSVRQLAARLLRDSGYEVIEAAGGEEALEALDGGPVDLLLTDVVMSGMSGRELAERLTASRPELPVLFMSGYTDDVVVRHGVARDGRSFLPKPFTRETLLRAVSEVFSRRHG
jgi:PAS domain S-box-containing protein